MSKFNLHDDSNKLVIIVIPFNEALTVTQLHTGTHTQLGTEFLLAVCYYSFIC